MDKPIHQLKPEYFDIVSNVLSGFIFASIVVGTILGTTYIIIIVVLFIIAALFAAGRVGSLELYEQHFIIRTSFGKKEHKLNYSSIKKFAYQPRAPREKHHLDIYLHPPIRATIFDISIVSFGSVIQYKQVKMIYQFLKSKGIPFQQLPRTYQQKLDSPIELTPKD